MQIKLFMLRRQRGYGQNEHILHIKQVCKELQCKIETWVYSSNQFLQRAISRAAQEE